MPQRDIIFQKDSIFHVYNRGNKKERIFYEPRDYEYYIKRLQKYSQETETSIGRYPFFKTSCPKYIG